MDKPQHLHFPLPDLDLEFVEGGTFDMGDETGDLWDICHPVHSVAVSSFYLCQYPVTQRLFEHVMGTNPSRFKGEKRPVETVSWDDAKAFIDRLNSLETVKNQLLENGLSKAVFRLPTEAEWEYAARGGIYSQGYTYAGSDKLKQVGWYDENSGYETHDVGQLLANELGLYDMSGNVLEWCEDWFDGEFYEKCHIKGLAENPVNRVQGDYRSLRGGFYFNNAEFCRPACRDNSSPDYHSDSIGFRLCLSLQSVGG
jgi:formylglycine-generating enzyme required for sulfatase activity